MPIITSIYDCSNENDDDKNVGHSSITLGIPDMASSSVPAICISKPEFDFI